MSEWQPIDTAPAGDLGSDIITTILLWIADGGDVGRGCVGLGYCYRRRDGSIKALATGYRGFRITHWMPLPPPPVQP